MQWFNIMFFAQMVCFFSCSVSGQTQINSKVKQKNANKVGLDIPWNMVPRTSDREMIEFGGRPWREAWFCPRETLLVHVWPIVFQQFPSFVVCLCSKKKMEKPLQPSLRYVKTSGAEVFSGFGFCVTEAQTRYNSLQNGISPCFSPIPHPSCQLVPLWKPRSNKETQPWQLRESQNGGCAKNCYPTCPCFSKKSFSKLQQ